MTVRRVSKAFAVVDSSGALRVVQPGDLFEDGELFAPPPEDVEVPDRRTAAMSQAFGHG